MSQPIKIIVSAETAEAAAALRNFTQQAGSGLKSIAASGESTATSLRQMRESALGLREGFHVLETGVYLLGGQRFPELATAVLGARSGMMLLRTASLLTGEAMSELALAAAPIVAIIGAGLFAWHEYSAAEQEAADHAKAVKEALDALPDSLKKIQDAAKVGILRPGEAEFLSKLVSGEAGMTVSMPLSQALREKRITEADVAAGRVKLTGGSGPNTPLAFAQESTVNVPMSADERQQLAMQQLVRRGFIEEVPGEKGKPPEFKLTELGKQMQDIMALRDKLHEKTLSATEKENEEYQKQLEVLKRASEFANAPENRANKSAIELRSDLPALRAQLQADHQLELQKLQDKTLKTVESPTKVREEGLKQFAEASKQIEQEITNQALAGGKDRQDLWREEYQRRIVLAQQAVFSGQIDEQTYKTAIIDAQNAMYQGQKRYNDELARTRQIEQEIVRGKTQSQLRNIEDNPFLSQQEKARQSVPLIQEQIQNTTASASNDLFAAWTTNDEAARLKALDDYYKKLNEVYSLQKQLNAAQGENSFAYQMQLVVTHFDNLNNLARESAQIFQGAMTVGINSIASNLTKVIEGTESWKKALSNIGESILTEILQGIIRMFTTWIVDMTIMKALSVVLGQTSVLQAHESTAAWAPAAVAAAIATSGEAASVGFATALAAMSAGATFGGALAAGGPVEAGKAYLVGESGPEYMIAAHDGTVIPNHAISELSGKGAGAAPGAGGNQAPVKVESVVVNDRQALDAYLKGSTAQHIIVQHLTDPSIKARIGIPT
jgi:hypothetical protein